MQAFFKLLYKDFLVLIRDRGGLAMLFLLPVALVLIMTSVQDSTFRSIDESGVKMLLLNRDQDSLGLAIEREMLQSNLFQVHTEINGRIPDEEQVKEAVAMGRYQIGMIIPPNTTVNIRNKVRNNVALALSGEMPVRGQGDSITVRVFLDPATKTSFRESLQLSVHDFTSRVESQIVLQEVTKEINKLLMVPVPDLSLIQEEAIHYREEYALRGDNPVIPNSVQHNVPAWTIFAMFFIAIPLAGGMIKEREDGSLARLLTMPCNYAMILISKMLVYLVICFLQFVLILLMGMHFFPLINLPALQIGENLGMLTLLAFATSLASIGYGILVGTVARTHQQASIFAAISVVILAALGGVWVPVFVMPPFLRHISVISPLNWGLNGFYDILIRDASFSELMAGLGGLILFSVACLGMAIGYRMLNRENI